MISPAHTRIEDTAGMGESIYEFDLRMEEFRRTIPWGTSTRCEVHNAPPKRKGQR